MSNNHLTLIRSLQAGFRKIASLDAASKTAAAPAPAVSAQDQKLIADLALSLSSKVAMLVPDTKPIIQSNADAFASGHVNALSGACKVLDYMISSNVAAGSPKVASASTLGSVVEPKTSATPKDKQQVSKPRC